MSGARLSDGRVTETWNEIQNRGSGAVHSCLPPLEIGLLRQSKREIDLRFAENKAHRKVKRAALANPDLPDSFIAESLISMAEPRGDSLQFVPRGLQTDG